MTPRPSLQGRPIDPRATPTVIEEPMIAARVA
jgi:hypothetical protein